MKVRVRVMVRIRIRVRVGHVAGAVERRRDELQLGIGDVARNKRRGGVEDVTGASHAAVEGALVEQVRLEEREPSRVRARKAKQAAVALRVGERAHCGVHLIPALKQLRD